MSPVFIKKIDFRQKSKSIELFPEDELFDKDESIENFAKKLGFIAENYSFLKQLETRDYNITEVILMIEKCCKLISEQIDLGKKNNETREEISERMIRYLKDVCEGAILANCLKYYNEVNLRTAWEFSLTDIKTKFLSGFLQGLRYIGLRVPQEGQNERLMVKYYGFLWRIREFLDQSFGVHVLANLEDFPQEICEEDKEFNYLVARSVEETLNEEKPITQNRYYIQKRTAFYVSNKRFFEYTLQLADKFATKYNRVTAYSKHEISTNYPIQIGYEETKIHLWDQPMGIKVITSWCVSIAPVVLNKLAKILRFETRLSSRYNEYYALMNYLTETGMNFLDLVDFGDKSFHEQLSRIYDTTNTQIFRSILEHLHNNFGSKSIKNGRNTIRYALINLREDLIDSILPSNKSEVMEDASIYISRGCFPFEKHPLMYNLPKKKTNGKTVSTDVLRAYGSGNAIKYMPYIRIKHLIEETGELYHKRNEVERVELGQTINDFNSLLRTWDKNQGCKISEEEGYVFLDEYVGNTVKILQILLHFTSFGNDGQQQLNNLFVKNMIKEGVDEQKIATLEKVFVDSHILAIYGAAGTGKTTLLNFISNLFEGRKKVFLTKTHAALDNMKKRIAEPGYGSVFDVIDHFNSSGSLPNDYDIIFVDECSTIDNRTMIKLLSRISTDSLLVCAGDIYQIEPIDFGNWFYYAREVLPQKAMVELMGTWRTNEQSLINLWDAVRYLKPVIREMLAMDGPFSKNIGKDLFYKNDEDEVVLCLNYDGKFGLNCINSYFQDANPEKEYYWAEWKYKANDPVLFNENKRFPMLYNNLKGKIVSIEKGEDCLFFTIDIPPVITALDIKGTELEIIPHDGETIRVRFGIYANNKIDTEDGFEEAQMRSVVPFQLAYAVSIHKAQGLEYNSIKLVIPNSNSEKITHGIFYTAITRTKKYLKIFCTADTLETIRNSFNNEKGGKESLKFIRRRLGLGT